MGRRDRVRTFIGTAVNAAAAATVGAVGLTPRVDESPSVDPVVAVVDEIDELLTERVSLAEIALGRSDRAGRRGAATAAAVFTAREDEGTEGGEPQVRMDSSVVNALTGLGGADDKGAAARPNTARQPLDDRELAALYLNNGIARRIVDVVPAEATRNGWTVKADVEGSDKRAEVDSAAAEDRRLQTVSRVREAWSLARLWGHSIVVMVTEDDIPAKFAERPEAWLAQPLDLDRVKKVTALQVFDALECWPVAYDGDIRSKTFRQPLIWGLTPSIPGVSSKGGGIPTRIHASRVLHFRGRMLPPSLQHSSGVFGRSLRSTRTRALDDSVLRAVWDEIRNLSQTMAGGATLAQELRESVLKIAGLRGVATADQAKEVAARMQLIAKAKSLLGVLILGENDEYDNRSNPPTGFRELSTEAQAMLSAVTETPLTILFGHAPAGLSTDDKSGRQTWDRKIKAEQGSIAPLLVRLYETIFAASEGVTPGNAPVNVRPKFEPLHEPTQAEQATTYKTTAEGDAIYLDRGVINSEQTQARFSEEGFQTDLPPADDADLDEIDDEAAREIVADIESGAGDDEAATVETAAGELPAGKFSDVAFNGAQVAQAVGIAVKVGTGELPRVEAVAMLVHLFNLPAEAAEAIIPPEPDPADVPAAPDDAAPFGGGSAEGDAEE